MKFLDVYWVIYFIGYLVAVAVLLWMHWNELLRGNNQVLLLAAIYGVAAGSASAFAILLEGGGHIVLLIPARIRKLKREGRQELESRLREAYRRFGVEVDGVVMLPRTPEVQAFLDGEAGESDRPAD